MAQPLLTPLLSRHSLLHLPPPNGSAVKPTRATAGSPRFRPSSRASLLSSSFTPSSAHVFCIPSAKRKIKSPAISVAIRCEQGAKENNGLDVWLSRVAMVSFVLAITIELTTGKGILENLGFATPLPTLALALTALVGVVTAFIIFQSASRD